MKKIKLNFVLSLKVLARLKHILLAHQAHTLAVVPVEHLLELLRRVEVQVVAQERGRRLALLFFFAEFLLLQKGLYFLLDVHSLHESLRQVRLVVQRKGPDLILLQVAAEVLRQPRKVVLQVFSRDFRLL